MTGSRETWGDVQDYRPGDRVVKRQGSLAGVILRETKPARRARRYSVRDDISGTVGTHSVYDLRPRGGVA